VTIRGNGAWTNKCLVELLGVIGGDDEDAARSLEEAIENVEQMRQRQRVLRKECDQY